LKYSLIDNGSKLHRFQRQQGTTVATQGENHLFPGANYLVNRYVKPYTHAVGSFKYTLTYSKLPG